MLCFSEFQLHTIASESVTEKDAVAAGAIARKLTLELEKLVKEFR